MRSVTGNQTVAVNTLWAALSLRYLHLPIRTVRVGTRDQETGVDAPSTALPTEGKGYGVRRTVTLHSITVCIKDWIENIFIIRV